MNIGILAPYSRPFDQLESEGSGQNIFIRESSLALATAGHSVTIFRRRSRQTDKKIIKHGANIIEYCLSAGPPKRLDREATYKACRSIRITQEIKIEDFDFFIAHYWISEAWISQLFGIRPNKRFFYFPHSTRLNPYRELKSQEIQIFAETRLGDQVYWCVNTKREYKKISSVYGKNKTVYIRPGVDVYRIKKTKKSGSGILFVGRKNKAKGYDLFCRLAHDFPTKKFIAIGRSESALPIIKNLENIEFLPISKLAKKITQARLVVCPSRVEYFGLVSLLSVSLGTPVVATKTGGYQEVIREGKSGFFCQSGSYSALKLVFSQALESKLIVTDKVISDLFREFNWDNFVEKLLYVLLKTEKIFDGSIIKMLIKPKIVKGQIVNFEQAILPPSVHIIPIDSRGHVLLLKEKKVHSSSYKIGLVAGVVNKKEKLLQAAKRELLEESGYFAADWRLLAIARRQDVIRDVRHYYIAEKLIKKKINRQPNEDIFKMYWVSVDKLYSLWRSGQFGNAATAMAVYKFIILKKRNHGFKL